MDKQLTIEEGNKLIAEFMGWKVEYTIRQNTVYPSRMVYEFNSINPSGETVRSSKAHDNIKIEDGIKEEWKELLRNRAGKYHLSWDCLMPVIERISLHQYDDKSWEGCPPYKDYAWPRTFGMISEQGKYLFRFNAQQVFEADKLIDAAWQAVVQFIQLHNVEQNDKGSVATDDDSSK